jgi:hypothetical protein
MDESEPYGHVHDHDGHEDGHIHHEDHERDMDMSRSMRWHHEDGHVFTG